VAPWVLSVPLMLAATEVAHWLAFRLVYPGAYERGLVLRQTGHGYFSWLPLAGGIGCALLVGALVVHGRSAADRVAGAAVPTGLWRFALMPPLAFALQEHLERLISNGTVTGVVFEPTFTLGVALTLPFALVSYLAARLLLSVAGHVGRLLGCRRRLRADDESAPAGRSLRPELVFLPRVAVLATGHAERGPPL
jgi:hypothetical protein